MNNQNIYAAFVAAGLSPEGACGLMGNLQAESAMRSNNAQDGMTRLSDADYTVAADAGTIDFVHDSVGYGYAQWTYWKRKENLLAFCKARGASVGDAKAQIAFCIQELKTEYKSVWDKLCGPISVYDAAALVCTQYERPAVNNIKVRAQFGEQFYAALSRGAVEITPQPQEPQEVETVTISLKTLKRGMTDNQVEAAQILLNGWGFDCGIADGIFGGNTEKAVKALQKANGLTVDGIIGAKTWTALHNA